MRTGATRWCPKCRDYRSHWSSWRQECNLFASILAQLASMSAVAQSTPPLESGGAEVVRRGLEAVVRACVLGAALAMGEDGAAAGSGVMEMMIARALATCRASTSPCAGGGTVCLASSLDMALRCSQRRSFNSRLRLHVIMSSPGNCFAFLAVGSVTFAQPGVVDNEEFRGRAPRRDAARRGRPARAAARGVLCDANVELVRAWADPSGTDGR
jgi:hypothetical protein